MNIFTSLREGTPLLPGERERIQKEIGRLTALSPEEVSLMASKAKEFLPGWDAETETLCIDHDIHFMHVTLDTNIVTMG